MATNNTIILQGGGDHARVVIDCLQASGKTVIGIFDPKYSGELMGVKQLGGYQADVSPEAQVVVAIGDNAIRKKVVLLTRHSFVTAIHPSVIFSTYSSVGIGSMLMHGAIIQAKTHIGNHVIINTGAKVDHDCVVADYVHIGPGAVLCGSVKVGEGAFIGAGAVIIPGKKIGAWSVVGAGSVVIDDIPAHTIAVGNPARVIKSCES